MYKNVNRIEKVPRLSKTNYKNRKRMKMMTRKWREEEELGDKAMFFFLFLSNLIHKFKRISIYTTLLYMLKYAMSSKES